MAGSTESFPSLIPCCSRTTICSFVDEVLPKPCKMTSSKPTLCMFLAKLLETDAMRAVCTPSKSGVCACGTMQPNWLLPENIRFWHSDESKVILGTGDRRGAWRCSVACVALCNILQSDQFGNRSDLHMLPEIFWFQLLGWGTKNYYKICWWALGSYWCITKPELMWPKCDDQSVPQNPIKSLWDLVYYYIHSSGCPGADWCSYPGLGEILRRSSITSSGMCTDTVGCRMEAVHNGATLGAAWNSQNLDHCQISSTYFYNKYTISV